MSLSIALHNALTGLQASQSVIQTISNNVTNANTEGYTRKTSQPVSRALNLEGRGVDISQLDRVVDERLLSDLRANLGSLGLARTQEFYYQRVLDQFGTLTSDSSIAATVSDLASAMQGVAAAPGSAAHRNEAVNAAVALARQLNDLSTQVQDLRSDADKEISTKINVINGELTKLADLNRQIDAGQALGQATVELEDLRDVTINKISGLMDVQHFKRNSGEIVVALPDGKIIADKKARLLSHTPASSLAAEISYPGAGINGILSGGLDITADIAGGELAGLIQARDEILPNLQSELDGLAQKLRDELNTIHNAGSSRPPAQTLTGTRTFAAPPTDTITLSSATRIAVVDEAGKFVAHFDLAAGSYTVTDIESAIDTNLFGFATASTAVKGPLSISANAAGQGIAIVDLGAQTVTHTDGSTTYSGFSNYFGLNDLFVSGTKVQGGSSVGLANSIQVRGDIVADPALLSRGTLSTATSPTPLAGDPAIELGDASIAQALADKFIEDLPFSAAGKLPVMSTTFGGFAAEILSGTAVSASVAQKTTSFRETLAKELTFRNAEVSGVNVDEELSNLVLYQNAYGATARVIQVVNDMFDELSNIIR